MEGQETVESRKNPADVEAAGGGDLLKDRRPAKGNRKVFTGQVVSDRMQKTIVVAINRKRLHPLYHKYMVVTKKVKAHDENNEAGIGDTVRIIESRPLSKHKTWRLVEILERAK